MLSCKTDFSAVQQNIHESLTSQRKQNSISMYGINYQNNAKRKQKFQNHDINIQKTIFIEQTVWETCEMI